MPAVNETFDIIIAYSVFTATGPSEMVKLVTELEKLLVPGGLLAFTFCDPAFNPAIYGSGYRNIDNFTLRLSKLNDGFADPGLVLRNRDSKWSILVNKTGLFIESENIPFCPLQKRNAYCAFYRPEVITSFFPHSKILAPPLEAYPWDHDAEMQHTCIIQKAGN